MGEAGVGERSHPAGVPGASGAGGRWRGGAEGSSPPGPCAAVTARGWTRTPTRDAPLASPSFLGGGVGRCGLTATRCARRPAPSACSPRAPGAARLGPRRRARIPTRETACKFMNEAPGSCPPPRPTPSRKAGKWRAAVTFTRICQWPSAPRVVFLQLLEIAGGRGLACMPETRGGGGVPKAGDRKVNK